MILSLAAQKAIFALETSDYPIILLTLTHDDLVDPIRVSWDATTRLPGYTTDENVVYGTVSNSYEFMYVPFELDLPTEEEDSAPQAKLSIYNAGRELVETIRSLRSSPKVRIELVLASNTDQVEGDMSGFIFSDIDIDEMVIAGTLIMDVMTNEPYPYYMFTPSSAPGLFK